MTRLDPNRNMLWARAIAEELERVGVAGACVAPGSRSGPLVLGIAGQSGIPLYVHLDERSAAFFALGLVKQTGRPAVVLCSSGTAAANLLPAAVEAYHSGLPLLLLTADRPPELQGCGAPQAIDQKHLFGHVAVGFSELPVPEADGRLLRAVRSTICRMVFLAEARGGPVHVNVPFRDPLDPRPVEKDVGEELGRQDPLAVWGRLEARENGEVLGSVKKRSFQNGRELQRVGHETLRTTQKRPFQEWLRPSSGRGSAEAEAVAPLIGHSQRCLVVVGPHSGSPDLATSVLKLAERLRAPVLADPCSQLRRGSPGGGLVLGAYEWFLRSPEFRRIHTPDLILRFGAPPTSKVLQQFLESCGEAEQILLDGPGARDPGHLGPVVIDCAPAVFCRALYQGPMERHPDERFLEGFQAAEQRAAELVTEVAEKEWFEASVVQVLARELPRDTLLFVGNSMPVRHLDAFLPAGGERLRLLANRGANGIDGVLSTALGAVAAGAGSGKTRPGFLFIGDLSLLHDQGGLLVARRDGIPLIIVVVNNDGGGIFSFLPVRNETQRFEELFATPHGLGFKPLAELYGMGHILAESYKELAGAVQSGLAKQEPLLIEVPMNRDQSAQRYRDLEARVVEAVEAQIRQGGDP